MRAWARLPFQMKIAALVAVLSAASFLTHEVTTNVLFSPPERVAMSLTEAGGSVILIFLVAGIVGYFFARPLVRKLDAAKESLRLAAEGAVESKTVDVGRASADAPDVIDAIADTSRRFGDLMGAVTANLQANRLKSFGFERASSALMMADSEMRIVHINDAFRELFEQHAEEIAHKWKGDDPDALIGESMDVFHRNPAVNRAAMSDASRFPLHADIDLPSARIALVVNTVLGDGDEIVGYYLEWEDVTEKVVNKALLASQNERQAIVFYDLDLNIKRANDVFRDRLGVEPDDIAGGALESTIADQMIETPEFKEIRSRFETENFIKALLYRKTSDSEFIWYDSAFTKVVDRTGKAIKWVEIASEVTEAETTVRAQRAILESIDRACAVIEFQIDGTIIKANQAFLDTVGYESEEIIGKHHSMFVSKELAESEAYSEHWRKLAAGGSITGTFERRSKSGDQIFIIGSYSPVHGPSGKLERVFKIVSDVTGSEKERLTAAAAIERSAEEVRHAILKLQEGLSSLSNGDLRHKINEEFSEAYEVLRDDFNKTMSQLATTVSNVIDRAGSIRRSAIEVSDAVSDLARRSETQATTLDQTTETLKQLTDGLGKAAADSDKVEAFTASAAENASASGKIVSESLDAMKRIENSSSQIAQIIGVIDDIAFQTNLLALNAGVEAARAGEAGRGFAVVASEVRSLAARCADAAKEIKELISVSVGHVESGVEFVTRTGSSQQEIVDTVQKIKELVGELAKASREHASGVSDVMIAMEQIGDVTQNNAAMVQEMTAASRELSMDAEMLSSQVEDFKVNEAGSDSPDKQRLPAVDDAEEASEKMAAA